MKKFLVALLLLALVAAGAGSAVLRFWPDTEAGGYAALAWERAKEWCGVSAEFWVEQWRRFRPAGEETPPARPKPVETTAAEKPAAVEETPVPAVERPPQPAVDLSKPWKGLDPENWYGGPKLTEKSLEGKIVMVYAFSESSEDSVALLPRIENVWSAYRTKPFVVLGSHRGGRSAKVAGILKKNGVTFSVYEDAGRTKEPAPGGRYPIVYVVDDTGRMVYRGRSDLEATEAVVTAIPDVGRRRKGAR